MTLISPQALMDTCEALDRVVLGRQSLLAQLQAVVDLARNHLSSRTAALLVKDAGDHNGVLVACSGGDNRLADHLRERCTQQRNRPCFLNLQKNAPVIEASDLMTVGWELLTPQMARDYDIECVQATPLWIDDEPIGLLCHFARPSAPFDPEMHRFISFLARRAEALIAQEQRLQHAGRYQELNRITLDLLAERDAESLLIRLLEEGLRLVHAERGWVSQLDFKTGELRIVRAMGNPQHQRPLPAFRGITWRALQLGTPLLVHDVGTGEPTQWYEPYWQDTRSELAVPLVIEAADVLVRREHGTGSKLIGVLNVESPLPHAFSEMDKELLDSLARQAAVLIDGLDLDRRLSRLTEAQQAMTGILGWDAILELMGQTIAGIIGCDYVNISMVSRDNKRIKTEFVLGVPEEQCDEFKRLADHALGDKDIQSSQVRDPHVEVPDPGDERFDRQIFKQFGHDRLIRVFVPMIASNSAVIGTVDAGYNRQYRQYIYEQDVRLLEGFVGYAVRALQQRQQTQMQRLSHELSAPLGGIRSNSDFLQRRWRQLQDDVRERKLGDIAVDAEILLLAVSELEYLLSGRVGAALVAPPTGPHAEPVLILRDIIIKTVRQLKPLILAAGLPTENVRYEEGEFRSIPALYVSQPELNQVIYNLLLNAIKYAKEDAKQFDIVIRAEVKDHYVIMVQDWGIGIHPEYFDRVFSEGFRTPEAVARHISGSGLGLTISRQLMRQMGGDLQLVRNAEPTEFHVILPKKLRDAPRPGTAAEAARATAVERRLP